MTNVKTSRGETNEFSLKIGLYQSSTLHPYLFNIVLDVLTASIEEEISKCMLLANNIQLTRLYKLNWETTFEQKYPI